MLSEGILYLSISPSSSSMMCSCGYMNMWVELVDETCDAAVSPGSISFPSLESYPGRGALFGQLSSFLYNRLIHWVGLS